MLNIIAKDKNRADLCFGATSARIPYNPKCSQHWKQLLVHKHKSAHLYKRLNKTHTNWQTGLEKQHFTLTSKHYLFQQNVICPLQLETLHYIPFETQFRA